LRRGQHFSGFRARHNHYTVRICRNDVARRDRHAVAFYGDICPCESIMPNRCRWHTAERVHRESDLREIRRVAHAAIDHSAGETARLHRRAHQSAHPGNIRAVFHHHHVNGVRTALINRGQHPIQCVRVLVFFFTQFHSHRESCESRSEDRLHAVRKKHALAGDLLQRVRYRRHFHMTVPVEQRSVRTRFRGSRKRARRICQNDGNTEQDREHGSSGDPPAFEIVIHFVLLKVTVVFELRPNGSTMRLRDRYRPTSRTARPDNIIPPPRRKVYSSRNISQSPASSAL